MATNFYSAVSPRPLQGNGWLSSAPLLIDRQSAENLKNSRKYQRTVGYPSTSWASCYMYGTVVRVSIIFTTNVRFSEPRRNYW